MRSAAVLATIALAGLAIQYAPLAEPGPMQVGDDDVRSNDASGLDSVGGAGDGWADISAGDGDTGADPLDAEPVAVRWTAADVLAARATASWCARAIIDGEVGGGATRGGVVYERWDPYMPGLDGEVGPTQLHSRGKLPLFYRQGYTDPHSPEQAVRFLEEQLQQGQGSAWSTAPRGCR